jgi:hypothetical protein
VDCDFNLVQYLQASVSNVCDARRRMRDGWRRQSLALNSGLGSGAARYVHALVGPSGEIRRLTTVTAEQIGIGMCGEGESDDRFLYDVTSAVPSGERLDAALQGATWVFWN